MQPTDVAIIGLACRFPAAANPDDLWRLVRDGREATEPIANVADFDAEFFNVSPREACAMDPRQRLALELTWELFEDAFVVPEALHGEQVAVYLGAMNDDYAFLTLRDAAEHVDHYSFAGTNRGLISNRVSYVFGLQGPSMTLDAGQSSSLVAVHLACESLRTGVSALAIAGGIHLNLASETAMLEAEFGAISKSGHTYAFDRRADGYVRSEGAGLVLLKPLRAALDDGNRIRAVISGSAISHAGHSAAGLTVPSVSGQADVTRRALSSAGLDCSQVDYVEAHGTGTEVGDPVEARALGEVFAQRRQRPVAVGSVKTNIGHAGSAAGIAGLLKTVLALENAMFPPSLNFTSANPDVDLESLGLRINTTLTPWPAQEGPRRAGVSSFGMGGTNAHVIVEESPTALESVAAQKDKSERVVPWVVSARSAAGLEQQAERLLVHVGEHPELHLVDVGVSLVTTRSVFEHRAVVVVADREHLMVGLAGLAGGQPGADVVVGRAQPVRKTVFVFPGQGSQWLGMGTGLYRRYLVFARAFDEAAHVLDSHLRVPLRQVMWGDDAALLESTEFAQPALFAIEVALAGLLQHCGVRPDYVMGHSVGEIAAAHVAGVLSLQDAARMVAARGRLMAELPAGGAMVALAASADTVAPLLTEGVRIAAVNGPDSVVISGPEEAVASVADRFAGQGHRVHRLPVSHAFHSALMEPMIERFSELLEQVSVTEPRIGLVSNVTGELAGPGYGSAQYWVDHVLQPVRFAQGAQTLESLGAGVFVEVGPGAVLTTAVEQSLVADDATSVVTLVKDRPEADSLLTALGRLFTTGVAVGWSGVFAGLGASRVELPTYGFVRQRFWLGATEAPVDRTGAGTAGLAERLRELTPREQHRELVELVCSHAAVVLGHPSSQGIDAERAFQDLGFDSMAGVELRNRLKTATGLTGTALSRTLIFDYPTPTVLAEHLAEQLLGRPDESDDDTDEAKIWSSLRKIPIQELRRTGLLDKLLLLANSPENPPLSPTVSDDVIDSLSPEALIAMAMQSIDEDEQHSDK